LLRDIQYVNKIKGLINRIKLQYSTNPQQRENSLLNDRDIQFNINDQLFVETLMMEIRGETISIASYKKKQQTNKQDKLLKEIDELKKKEIINVPLLEEKQKELQDIRKSKMEGKLIRSRAKWIFEGESHQIIFAIWKTEIMYQKL